MIGIGITTYMRPETDLACVKRIIDKAPKSSKIVLVQDVQGIAKAKNQCLSALDDCEHIFLFDADVWPTVDNWHLPYINSGVKHLSFTFEKMHNGVTNGNRILLNTIGNINIFQNPSGCMLYIHKECLETVGGFDERYTGYSYEHVEYSRRIYNAELTPFKYMDVKNSLSLFHSMDYYQEIKGSVPAIDRMKYIKQNRDLFNKDMDSKDFIKYK